MLALLFLFCEGRAQPLVLATPAQKRSTLLMKEAKAYPFRFDGTNIINLHPLINYYSAVDIAGSPRAETRPLTEWEFVQGKVLQPVAGGLIVQKYEPLDWLQKGDFETIYLTNHPSVGRLSFGDVVSTFAQSSGTYSYTEVAGTTKAIASYDCGYVLKGAQLEQAEKDWQQYVRTRQALQVQTAARVAKENKRLAEEKKKQRMAEQDEKAFKLYLTKAAEGDGPAQYRLAEFYLTGRGTTTNVAAARNWLVAAITNGHLQAETKLQALQKNETR